MTHRTEDGLGAALTDEELAKASVLLLDVCDFGAAPSEEGRMYKLIPRLLATIADRERQIAALKAERKWRPIAEASNDFRESAAVAGKAIKLGGLCFSTLWDRGWVIVHHANPGCAPLEFFRLPPSSPAQGTTETQE